MITYLKGKTMKKLLIVSIVVGMLIGAGGCMSGEYMRNTLNKPIKDLTVMEWMIQVDGRGKDLITWRPKHISLCQEQNIGAISRYNYNNLTSPYIIGKIPANRVDWMRWHVMNVKLDKYLAR